METVLITKTGRGNTHIKCYPEIHKIYIEIQQLFGDQNIADDIRNGNSADYKKYLGTVIEESDNIEDVRKAAELLVKLAKYKPLAKVEELEEENEEEESAEEDVAGGSDSSDNAGIENSNGEEDTT